MEYIRINIKVTSNIKVTREAQGLLNKTKKFTWPNTIILLIITIVLLVSGCCCYTSGPTVTSTKTTPAISITASSTATVTDLPATPTVSTGINLIVYYIDVGQGDSILLKSGNRAMLIDGGPASAGSKVVSFLREHGVNTIDVLVSTHPHEDHIGGLITVLESFEVKHVVDSGLAHTSRTYEKYLTLIDQKDIPYIIARRGDTIDFAPGVRVEVLSPPPRHITG